MSDAVEHSYEGGMNREPPIDIDAFRREMREQDLEDLVDELIETFLGDAPSRIEAFCTAVASAEATSIRSAAHAYKSAAGTMRATCLSKLLQQAEEAARDGDVTRPTELLDQIRQEHEAVLAHLRSA